MGAPQEFESERSDDDFSDRAWCTTKIIREAATIVDEVSTLLDPETHANPNKPIRVASVVFNLLNTTMGVGILSLATTFAYAGLGVGILVTALSALATYCSVYLLMRCIKVTGSPSFEELGAYCFGRLGRLWVQAVIILICLGGLVAFLVSFKSLLFEGLQEVIPSSSFKKATDHGLSKNTVMVMGIVTMSFPLSMLRRIDGLWFTSFLSVAAITYFVVVSVWFYFNGHPSDGCHELVTENKTPNVPQDSVEYARSSFTDLLQAVSIVAVSYMCQLTVFPILTELRVAETTEKAVRKMNQSTGITMTIACLLYTVAAASGYATWREISTKPSTILACYPTGNTAVVVVYFGMSAMLMFTFPLLVFTCRISILSVLRPGDHKPLDFLAHLALTVGITVFVAVPAFFADHLSTVLNILSALTSPSLCYLLPGLCFLKVQRITKARDEGADSDIDGPLDAEAPFLLQYRHEIQHGSSFLGYLMLCAGVILQIVCIAAAVLSAMQGF